MSPRDFEIRISSWAKQQPGLTALVLGGSRAANGPEVDRFSDWDFQIITTHPEKYYGASWLSDIAPCWCAHAERTPRGVIKVSAVFEDGLEADFVPLAAWQMKLVYFAMNYPRQIGLMPRRLRNGIFETRHFMLGSGYRLLVGGDDWKGRLKSLDAAWPEKRLSPSEVVEHTAAFWQKAVWVSKKIARPEPRSAQHWLHLLVGQHVYAMLEEEARIEGRKPRPEARKAERWLDSKRLQQTAMVTSTEQQALAETLLSQVELFKDVSRRVAVIHNVQLADYGPVEGWLRTELGKLISQPVKR